jgi:hypothetical protein
MPVIIVGSEKNFAALRPRLFRGRVATAAAREVEDAVAAANPHVDLTALQPGTILTVPDLPRVSVSGDVSLDDTTKEALDGLTRSGAAMLEQLVGAARQEERSAAAERKQLAKSLGAKELDAAAQRDKALGADLAAVREALDAEEHEAKQRAAALDDARADWSAELQALQGILP